MPIVAEEYQFVIGVDTHAASHSFAVIAPATRAVGQEAQFPATAAGLSRAVAWAGRDAGSPDVALVVVEGIGSYGAGVARAFLAAGYRVVEGGAQSAGDRRGTGKSDALDAVRIARSVIGTDTAQLREPRADGTRNALRTLIISREMMTRERTATVNALTALVRTTDLGLDARKALTIGQLRVIAAWRTRTGDAIDVAVARAEATRLARHALELGTHAAANARQLDGLVRQVAPTEAPASPVASPTDLPSPTDSPDDPALLGSTDVNNNVCDSGLEDECGDIGSSGVGTIFYASSAPFACGANMESSCNYLEVAPNGWNGKLVNCNGCGGNPNKTSDWGQSSIGTGKGYAYCTGSGNDNRIPNASGVIIGFGYMNTSAMLSMCDSGNAAEQVRGYTGGGQTDWSLPSLYELNALFYYPDRNAIGGFAADDCWSSSQSTKYNAWFQNFTKGNQREYEKKNPNGVRPVRAL